MIKSYEPSRTGLVRLSTWDKTRQLMTLASRPTWEVLCLVLLPHRTQRHTRIDMLLISLTRRKSTCKMLWHMPPACMRGYLRTCHGRCMGGNRSLYTGCLSAPSVLKL